MQLEVGAIVEGKVIKITKFGAFVELKNGKSGLVHISEVSTNFVKQVEDYLKVGDDVKVKVLSISDDGKIELSKKRVETGLIDKTSESSNTDQYAKDSNSVSNKLVDRFKKKIYENMNTIKTDSNRFKGQSRNRDNNSFNSNFINKVNTNRFEDMLNKFKKLSEEKLAGFEKTKSRRGRNSHKDNIAE